ncbi:GNAT family N-acetyltransferase [Devosia sp. A8/3-2]|nr:GNAT family N-acetyltransferase [Devosia sp. A8/3-2]
MIAACMYLQGNDEIFWPDYPAGEALYIHKLAVARPFAGLGLSAMMLDWAAQQAVHAGRQYLRLDCAPRAKLLTNYHDAGFSRVGGDIVVEGYSAARLQRSI